MSLVQCIYASAATLDFGQSQLAELLATSRDNNQRLEVTGMLLYYKGSFFQVLEGEEAVIETLYSKIAEDPRHGKLIKLIQAPINERIFAQWSMGYPAVTVKELATLPGLNDFFTSGKAFYEISAGRAKNLLAAFKQGKWRARL